MNYNEMTAAQCADWLAENDGWTAFARHPDGSITAWINERYASCGVVLTHPMPLTLDAAAGALREPWYLVRVSHYGVRWACHIERMNPACERMVVDAPDRMTAEYRAAVAARMEDDK